jgi:hypothetical protein
MRGTLQIQTKFLQDAKQLPNAYNSSAQRATSSTGNNRNGVAYGEHKTTDSEENPPEKMNALQSAAQEHCSLSIKQAQNCIRNFLSRRVPVLMVVELNSA